MGDDLELAGALQQELWRLMDTYKEKGLSMKGALSALEAVKLEVFMESREQQKNKMVRLAGKRIWN